MLSDDGVIDIFDCDVTTPPAARNDDISSVEGLLATGFAVT